MPTTTQLRFGILCGGTIFREWQALCIQQLMALESVTPALLVTDGRPPLPPKPLIKRLGTLLGLRINLFSLYSRYYVNQRAMASRSVDLSDVFKDVPQVRCEVTKIGKFSEYFTPEDIAEIRRHNLDFMLRFGFNIIRGEILTVARYGVWSFHHGDEQSYRGAPPCFWEIYYGEPQTGLILQRLTARLDGGVVLRKALFPTISRSYPANRDAAHYCGTSWPADICRDILNGQAGYLSDPPSKTSAPIYKAPSNKEMIWFALKEIRNYLAHHMFHPAVVPK